jgi:hypothetical protein
MGTGPTGGWVEWQGRGGAECALTPGDYLQQSFFRMKIAFSIRNKKPPKVNVLVDMVEDIIYNSPEGSQFLGIFIADLDPIFFFDGHERLKNIERVKAEVII